MKKITIDIDGMTCSACSNRIETKLNNSKGIQEATVNLVLNEANITYDDNLINLDDINKYIADIGYKSLGLHKEEKNINIINKNKLIINGIILIVMMYISMSNMYHLPILNIFNNKIIFSLTLLLFSIYFIIYGIDIIISGIKKIIYKSPNMDSLVTLGVLTSFIYSFINTILMIITKKGPRRAETLRRPDTP